jgi:flagellar basal-body rod protein FlgB
MVTTGIFSHEHLSDLKTALGVYAQRHGVVSENIANVETSGYKTRELRFEDLLSGARLRLAGARTQSGHLPLGARRLDDATPEVRPSATDYDNGTNNVDIDAQMADLATNDLSFRLATRLLSMRYGMLRGAIRGRASGA